MLRWFESERTSAILGLGFSLAFAFSFLIRGFAVVRLVAGSAILLFFLGHLLRGLTRVTFGKGSTIRLWSPAGIALDFLVSFAITIAITATLMVNFALYEGLLVALVLGLTVAFGLAILVLGRSQPPKIDSPVATSGTPTLLALASLVGLSIGIFVVFTRSAPYPSTRGWDLNATLATVSWAIEHHGFSYLLIAPFPETAALPYPASLAQAIASYSLFLGAPPDSIFYFGILPILVLYAVGVFGLAHKLSGRLLPSLFAGYAGLFLSTTNIETVRTPLFLTIDMLAQLMFIAIVLFYLGDDHGKARRWTILLLASAFLLYFYYYELIVVGPLLVFMLAEPLTVRDSRVRKRVFRVAFLLVLVGSIVGSVLIQVLVPGTQLDPLFGFPTEQKLFVLAAIYPPAFIALLALALVSRPDPQEQREVRGFDFRLLFEYAIFYGILFFLPLWAIYRVEFYFRLALVLLIAAIPIPRWAAVMASFRSREDKHLRAILRTPGPERRFLIHMAVATVACLMMLVSIPTSLELHDAYLSVDEYQTAMWIKAHTTNDMYIITDPGTGYILRGFALRNASIFFLLSDGRAPEIISSVYPNLRSDLHGIFAAKSQQEAWNRTVALGFTQAYVLVSTRTVFWTQQDPSTIFTGPTPGGSFDPFLRTFVPPHFVLEFETPTTFVFKVTS
jgi:hypothetical protein